MCLDVCLFPAVVARELASGMKSCTLLATHEPQLVLVVCATAKGTVNSIKWLLAFLPFSMEFSAESRMLFTILKALLWMNFGTGHMAQRSAAIAAMVPHLKTCPALTRQMCQTKTRPITFAGFNKLPETLKSRCIKSA